MASPSPIADRHPATTSLVANFVPGSYRDRGSRVFRQGQEICRALDARALLDFEELQGAQFFQKAMRDGRVVRTSLAPEYHAALDDAQWAGVLRHELIPCVSWPYEWTFGMLRDAALLQLELMLAALAENFILKDATPYNIQFVGQRCNFIDVGSFSPYVPGTAWHGYRQFCQMFLYPLMLQAYHDVDFQPWLRGRLEGISPRQFLNLMSLRDLVRPGVFTHVYLHAKMEQVFGESPREIASDLHEGGFHRDLISANIRQLQRLISRLRWTPRQSAWSEYEQSNGPAKSDGDDKAAFVRRIARSRTWNLAWDLGCNAGRYSRLVADQARTVLALDADHLTVERLYLALKADGPGNILPLVCNLADPSPAQGWRCLERSDLAARGRPDLILCLALVHHLVLRENILLPDLVDWLTGHQAELVIEFIDKSDPQARSLLANRTDQYHDYSPEVFEQCLNRRCDIRAKHTLGCGTRTLYHAVPR